MHGISLRPFARQIHQFEPSVLSRRTPKLSQEFKYRRLVPFKSKAQSRINILKRIIPEEYQLKDELLFKCLYFESVNTIQLKNTDESDESLRISQSKLLIHGQQLLSHEIFNYVYKRFKGYALTDGIPIFDLMGDMRATIGLMNNFENRKRFIDQFLHDLDNDDNLDVEIFQGFPRQIKLQLSSRHKIIPAVIGCMNLELGPAKCSEFTREFVIQGRQSSVKDYTHKGLRELYRDHTSRLY